MKATMSSFRECRLSRLIVKQSFSQMRMAHRGQLWKADGRVREGGPKVLVWNQRNPRRIRLARIRTPRLCLPECSSGRRTPPLVYERRQKRVVCGAAATDEGRWAERQGADQQVRLPGPMRAWADGGGLSRGGLVWRCAGR